VIRVDSALGGTAAFLSDPTPKAILDRKFVIRAVNAAYTAAAGRDQRDLLSVSIFEAFPANPDDPQADGVDKLRASFERVLRTGRPHNMLIQRYDIPDPRNPGEFLRRHWVPVNSPIRSGNEVVGIVHQATDVTLLREDVLASMEYYRVVLAAAEVRPEEAEQHQRMVDAFTDGISHFNDLAEEVTQLRSAMATRATIEQAKGALMLARRCGPDEAFDILRRRSRGNNMRLVDVAAAMIHRLQATK
jgi:two-component system, response regulator / RNA-binding antiterminator